MATSRGIVVGLALLAALSAGAVWADEGQGYSATTPVTPQSDSAPEGSYPVLDVPTKDWAYETDYFFGLTRGLSEERLTSTEKGLAMVGTITYDVISLPGAALAGLFGS
jgi:hypothetical protein